MQLVAAAWPLTPKSSSIVMWQKADGWWHGKTTAAVRWEPERCFCGKKVAFEILCLLLLRWLLTKIRWSPMVNQLKVQDKKAERDDRELPEFLLVSIVPFNHDLTATNRCFLCCCSGLGFSLADMRRNGDTWWEGSAAVRFPPQLSRHLKGKYGVFSVSALHFSLSIPDWGA